MIVAHPDDEVLFGGAELIQNYKEYKVVALDYGNHLIRHREFIKAMETIGIQKWEHWDGEPFKSSAAYNESILIPLITRVLEERTWTKIVTHNQSGEYGHYCHVNLHNVLARLCPEKLWVFDRDTDNPVAPDILEIKNHILTNVYQSQNHILKWFDWNHETIVKY